MKIIVPLLLFLLLLSPAAAQSVSVEAEADLADIDLDYAHVLAVEAANGTGGRRFAVTVRHGDEGWGHYADLWVVVDAENGTEYGRRILAHPHDTEQPFTRSQSGIEIPDGVRRVTVKARCTRHGFGGTKLTLTLP